MQLRLATTHDIPVLEELIRESVYQLQTADYTLEQIEGALGTVYGIDRQMVADGTYYVVEVDGEVAACGGWSARKTPFGGDYSPQKDDSFLDPATDAARIRAFFVRPRFTRRGIGTLLFEECRKAAAERGFRALQLTATLTGIPLYRALGFVEDASFPLLLPNQHELPVVRMIRQL